MSIFGDKSLFAIECEKSCVINNFTYINFQFWIGDEKVGDYEDEISLSSCLSYFLDFLKFSGQRHELELDQMLKEDVFRVIYESIILTIPENVNIEEILSGEYVIENPVTPKFENIQERFHLDSIGMSSFQDKFSIILVETELGFERIIWRKIASMKIREIILPPHYFETVANQFIFSFSGRI
jgi:hypothetical protein